MMEPKVLKQCIPACQVIEKNTDESFTAQVKVKFGFIPVKFNVHVLLSDIDPPRRYDLQAQASGGLAHAAKATGNVEFVALDQHSTRVSFSGEILPGSKLFELGEPIVQKTASKWFRRFFERFEATLKENTEFS